MKTTPLHSQHTALGAKMGEFAGYDMPLYYGEGVLKEHDWTRERAGLFDVSHMGQIEIEGPDAAQFWERLTPSAFQALPEGRAKYTVLTNEAGGIVDDLIITRRGPEKFFAVINAGCKDKDIAWIKSHLPAGLKFTHLEDRALIALQGPAAETALREVLKIEAADMPYMWLTQAGDFFVSRLGYTGEDGFELSVRAAQAPAVWQKLLEHPAVKPVGLAARDSLRLDMGYPLYGHDIDDTTSPVEAALEWVMGKDNTGFIGAERVLKDRAEGSARRRTGLILTGPGIAREGAEVAIGGKVSGRVTSGGFSPTLKKAVAMAYLDPALITGGAALEVVVRGRAIPAQIAAMPFVQPKTKSMKKAAA